MSKTLGSYADEDWFSSPIIEKKAKTIKKIKKKKVTKYLIFEEWSNIEEDEYWKKTFSDISQDVFPKGFSIRGQNLIYRGKNHSSGGNYTQIKFLSSDDNMVNIANIKRMFDDCGFNFEPKNVAEEYEEFVLTWEKIMKKTST